MLSPTTSTQEQAPDKAVATVSIDSTPEPLKSSEGPEVDRGSALREANPDSLFSKPAQAQKPEPQPVVNEAAKSAEPTQGELRAHDQEKAKRGTAEDPRVVTMRQEETRVAEQISEQELIISGSYRQYQNLVGTYEKLGVVDSCVGTTTGLYNQISAQVELIDSQRANLQALQERQTELAGLHREVLASEIRGKELEAQGNLVEAQIAYNQAATAMNTFVDKSGMGLTFVTPEFIEAQAAALKAFDGAIKTADTAYRVAKTTQTVLVVTGATIATGGAALAVAGTGALAVGTVGVVAGTATGTTIGLVTATGEAVSSVATGQKTASEAAGDAAVQTAGFMKDSAIASVGTVIGIGIGGKIAGAAAARLEKIATPALTKALGGAANGATAGASNAAVSTTAAITEDFVNADAEFAKLAQGKGDTALQREEAYGKFLAQRGLSFEAITERYTKALAIGAVGGASGGAVGVMQYGATTTAQKVGVTAVQIGSDTAIGVGVAALEGNLTAENIVGTIGQSVIGSAVGQASQKVHEAMKNNTENSAPVGRPEAPKAAQTQQPTTPPARTNQPSLTAPITAPATEPVGAAGSFKIEIYGDLKPATPSPSLPGTEPIPFPTQSPTETQPQQQVLKMAAGAENANVPVGPELTIAGNSEQHGSQNAGPVASADNAGGNPTSRQTGSGATGQSSAGRNQVEQIASASSSASSPLQEPAATSSVINAEPDPFRSLDWFGDVIPEPTKLRLWMKGQELAADPLANFTRVIAKGPVSEDGKGIRDIQRLVETYHTQGKENEWLKVSTPREQKIYVERGRIFSTGRLADEARINTRESPEARQIKPNDSLAPDGIAIEFHGYYHPDVGLVEVKPVYHGPDIEKTQGK